MSRLNFRQQYWDDLFKGLIDIHLVNGNHFDDFIQHSEGQSYLKLERLDYSADSTIPFLRYTFCAIGGETVVYAVNNKTGGGLEKIIVRVAKANGEVMLLEGPNPEVESIMRECYLFAVKAMDTIWYE